MCHCHARALFSRVASPAFTSVEIYEFQVEPKRKKDKKEKLKERFIDSKYVVGVLNMAFGDFNLIMSAPASTS